ncbi:MAG: branched-chain amino acid ABC transporter substrate-binding protein [Acetobacteraceae bacterium]|nr:branched-chain amino acid ABC transporter substrate-binding protein [Pseudomonadota bacterium]
MKRLGQALAGLAFVVCAMLAIGQTARAQDTIKIAFIGPFSGAFAPQGDAFLKELQFSMDVVNAKGGALGKKFELVTFDDKIQPAEALIALKAATDQNIQLVIQCIGSNVAAAMIDGVAKHNARNPERPVLYLNCAALANELTNEKCDFWHFRFAAEVSQRVYSLILGLPKDIKTVYLMNQDYLYGQSVRADMRTYLAKLRPDVQIIGDDMVPLGKVKDFAPYIAKIKASGAQAVLTSNWGVDFNLLLKSGVETALDVKYYTLAAHLNGGPTAMGEAGVGRVFAVVDFHHNVPAELNNAEGDAWIKGFRDKYPEFDYTWLNFRTMFEMLQMAVNKAGSVDPLKVALALEGMQITDLASQTETMRKEDHQLIGPLWVAEFAKGVKYDSEKTGFGWKTVLTVPSADLALPTTCKMKRPPGA